MMFLTFCDMQVLCHSQIPWTSVHPLNTHYRVVTFLEFACHEEEKMFLFITLFKGSVRVPVIVVYLGNKFSKL